MVASSQARLFGSAVLRNLTALVRTRCVPPPQVSADGCFSSDDDWEEDCDGCGVDDLPCDEFIASITSR